MNSSERHEPDRALERPIHIARTRWNLEAEAQRIAAELRRQRSVITAEIIAHRLVLAVDTARPKSRLVAWHLDQATVEAIIRRVAAETVE